VSETEAKPKRTRTRKGRPKGAATAERKPVAVNISPCRHCGKCCEPTNKRGKRYIRGDGSDTSGSWKGVTLWAANCSGCGGAVIVRQPDYLED
jgi:hypothetical protein